MSTDFFFFLFFDVALLVLIVVPLSPSRLTKVLFLKAFPSRYWFSRDRITYAGVQLESTTGEMWSGRCWSPLSIKPLPFVTLVGMKMVVVVSELATGFWCFEAADGVINKGTCSGFSAKYSSPHLNIHCYIKIKSTANQSRGEKIENKKWDVKKKINFHALLVKSSRSGKGWKIFLWWGEN